MKATLLAALNSTRPARRSLAACVASGLLLVFLTGCTTLYTKRIQFENHPIAVRVKSEIIDEENLLYSVVFRNTGREIVSFGYTIADEEDVVHVDVEGPNSGLIENLYPGAEVEVESPIQRIALHVTLGTVVYGKQSSEKISQFFRPRPPSSGGDGGFSDAGGLPTL